MRDRNTTSGLVFSQAITMLFGPIRSEMSSRPSVAVVVRRFGSPPSPGHDVDFGVAVVLRSECELCSVRREMRERGVAGAARQAARDAAISCDSVKFAA